MWEFLWAYNSVVIIHAPTHYLMVCNLCFPQIRCEPWEHYPLWAEHWDCPHRGPGLAIWVCSCHPPLPTDVWSACRFSGYQKNILFWCFPQVSSQLGEWEVSQCSESTSVHFLILIEHPPRSDSLGTTRDEADIAYWDFSLQMMDKDLQSAGARD